MSTRFEYIPYNDFSQETSSRAREICYSLEQLIDSRLNGSREKALAITKLEECFMWIGKAIREDQYKTERDQHA